MRENSGPPAFASRIPGLKSETWGTHLFQEVLTSSGCVTFAGFAPFSWGFEGQETKRARLSTLRNQQQFSRRLASLKFDMRLPRIGQWIDVLHADLQLPGIHCCQHLFSTRHQLFPRVYVVF